MRKSSPPLFGNSIEEDLIPETEDRGRSVIESDSDALGTNNALKQTMLLKANLLNRMGLGTKAFGSMSADYVKKMALYHERERRKLEEENRAMIDPCLIMERSCSFANETFCIDFFEKSDVDVRRGYINKLVHMKIMKLEPSKKHQSIIIFDWDDTLLCTSFLLKLGEIDKSSDVMNALKPLDDASSQLLLKAVGYGQVLIITNSEEGWVEYSAKFFLPKTLEVITQKKIEIVSARTNYQHIYPSEMRRWKEEAFLQVKKKVDTNITTNLIVLGDSNVEIEAAHLLGKQFSQALVKTVKFKENPEPDELIKQIELVYDKLETIFIKLKNLTVKLERKSNLASSN